MNDKNLGQAVASLIPTRADALETLRRAVLSPDDAPPLDEGELVLLAPSSRPDVSSLPDAFRADGTPAFAVGDKIVIERRSGLLDGAPYVDTRTWFVNGFNPATGQLALWDEELLQHGSDNVIAGVARGSIYKLAAGASVGGKRKRGRPRKNPLAPVAPPVPTGEKKKRGRPKGSKNRPAAAIRAEKAAKAAARTARRAARR